MTKVISRAQFLRGDFRGSHLEIRPAWSRDEIAFTNNCSWSKTCIEACAENIHRLNAVEGELFETRGQGRPHSELLFIPRFDASRLVNKPGLDATDPLLEKSTTNNVLSKSPKPERPMVFINVNHK